ncbi:MAG: hypothetical protein AAF798_15270, partial [Bacteroidota bacterium]
DEIEAGQLFWTILWEEIGADAATFEKLHKGAWQSIATSMGSGRAAHVLLQTRPTNWPTDVLTTLPTGSFPNFPKLSHKEESWTLPPQTFVMPDSFVVHLYNGGNYRKVMGEPIAAFPLILGPDPEADEFFEEDKGQIKANKSIQWLFDFDQAVADGMAVKVPLSKQEYNQGFDKILAIGLRLTSDIKESQELLEDLIDNHHYGNTGFGILPQGAPTNNTKDKPSAYSGWREDHNFTFQVEQQEALFGLLNLANAKNWRDGQWLCQSLGVQESVLQHIAYADHTDRAEAIGMNEALWDATLGYYFKHLMVQWANLQNNTLSLNMIDQIKAFFNQHISGRGGVPAIRVGNQPYGILPTTAYSSITWPDKNSLSHKMATVLRFFSESWRQKIDKVKTVAQGSTNWQQDFMDIIGLHAHSVEYHQRVGIGPLLYYLFAINAGSPLVPNTWINDKMNRANQINSTINGLDASANLLSQQTRASMLTWFPFGNKITSNLIDEAPLSEATPLTNDYISYLLDEANTGNIVKNYLTKNAKSHSLLYLMLRQSFLLKVWEVLWAKAHTKRWVDQEFMNLFSQKDCDAIFYRYINANNELPPGIINELNNSASIQKFRASLQQLMANNQSIPTARLERLLVEHLDLCTYRMDAWWSGVVGSRLENMRKKEAKGSYLGAFGWLLNVRRTDQRVPVPKSEIPSHFANGKHTFPLTYEVGNAGFIHAPSIAQATSSAVLRQGFLSKDKASMEVNISSQWVRLAREIIQGMQNGQELGALLGYRFERALHEKSAANVALELDQYIYTLRKKFPLSAAADAGREDVVESNNVVHGLHLLQAYRSGGQSIQTYLQGSGISNTELQAIHATAEDLENIIDAIADLTMAEGIHQSVLGNHQRAGAILNAIGDGKKIPDPQFIETPRSGIVLNQRFGMFLKTPSKQMGFWSSAEDSPRAFAAPHLNTWLGEQLGDPALIACKAAIISNPDTDTELRDTLEVSLQELALQPIDTIFLLNDAFAEENSLLPQLILYWLKTKSKIQDGQKLEVNFRDRDGWGIEKKSFFEILPLARCLYKVLTDSQVLEPTHFQTPSSIDTAAGPISDYDINELKERFQNIDLATALQSLQAALTVVDALTEVNGAADNQAMDKLRDQLVDVALFGLLGAMPRNMLKYDKQSLAELKAQAERVEKEMIKRLEEADAIRQESADTIEERKDKHVNAIKACVGKAVPVAPKFKLPNFASVQSAVKDKASVTRNAISPLVMEDWLSGVTKVRDKLKNWQLCTILANGFGATSMNELYPIQLPYQKDDQWLAIEFEEAKIEIAGDPLSLVLNMPRGLVDNEDGYGCGLLIDEWVEKIPYRQETTGVSFNYKEPQSEAPQTILLAIPPRIKGEWVWDDLVDTLNETLEMAMLRAIDPDLLQQQAGSAFNPFLPGILSPVTSDHRQTVALNFNDANQV